MVLADIHNREIAARGELEEDQVLEALRKGVKLRQDRWSCRQRGRQRAALEVA